MPITPTWPGVYVEEIPSGVRTITGVSTSITAFVGYTVDGPLDEPARISNFGDFERCFGGLDRKSLMSYVVRQFFLNGGGDAYVVRVATGALGAEVELTDVDVNDVESNKVLEIDAASAGQRGNRIRLEVDYDTTNPDSSFNLKVVPYEMQMERLVAGEPEPYRNLSMNAQSSRYVSSVVNNASDLVQVSVPSTVPSPSSGGYSLSGARVLGEEFPDLTNVDIRLTVTLDSSDQKILQLADSPQDADELISSLELAIREQGWGGDAENGARLEVHRATADGQTSDGQTDSGEYLKLESTSTSFASAVCVEPAPLNGLAAALKLGIKNGGREKEAASYRRPAPNGTISSDLAGMMGVALDPVQLDLRVTDHSQSSPTPSQPFDIKVPKETVVGPALCRLLEREIRKVPHSATEQASVEFQGKFLVVRPGDNDATCVISMTSSSDPDDFFGFPATQNALQNVGQYRLGSGPTVGAQMGAVLGSDGAPPDADTLKGSYKDKTGIYALRDVDLFNLLAIPDATWGLKNEAIPEAAGQAVLQEAAAFCEQERAFLLIDPPPELGSPGSAQTIDDVVSDLQRWLQAVNTNHAAIYFPCIQAADPLDEYRVRNMPASGAIAGVMARTDSGPGVWKAPAGTEAAVRGVQALGYHLTDPENGVLNKLGINCLRTFPAYGSVVWGARTLEGSDQQQSDWKYIPVRRLALYIEESLYRGTQWVVFEPNDEPLWAQIRLNLGAFMQNLFRQGAFQGMTPRQAYFVKCDKETTTQNDINLGIVNILVGFAPLKPAEFVIIKIQQIAGQIQT